VLHRTVTEAVRTAGDTAASLPTPPGGAVNEPRLCLELLEKAGFRCDSLLAEIATAAVPV
jgi:hypothetical protein